ncbi:putative glycosyl transferase group 1 [Candidatus Zixiibacteriota bacterium]|nr:putative glycosyl transferase group 1 [candidate division Zixibacteria bacterium]
MKKVLIVSYVFPPMAAVGVHRIVNFCKFLPQFGWRPVVLTVKGGVNASWDATPLESIPETIIYRSLTFEPLLKREMNRQAKESYSPSESAEKKTGGDRRKSLLGRLKRFIRLSLSVPDYAIFWVPFGVIKGIKIVRKENISVIMSSSPPVSAHIVASLVARLTGRPHLVDFRDLWTLNHNYSQRGYPGYFMKYDRFWERMVLKRARLVTTASPGFSRQMESHLGGFLAGKIRTITNGFDYGEVDLGEELSRNEKKRLQFLYTGALYSHFNPIFFLESVAEWFKEDKFDPETVAIDFYGNCDYDYSDWVKRVGLEQIVKFHGFVPRAKLLPIIKEADCLLLLLGFRPEAANVIPAKLFEYLASGAKILALAPEGVASELIKKYGTGVCINREDRNVLKEVLRRIYLEWRNSPLQRRKYRYIEDIDRKKLTGRMAALLEHLTAAKNRGAAGSLPE